MNYAAALNEIYNLSPAGICLGLDRVRSAASLLGDPQKDLHSVQVAGTNGKGVVAKLVSHAATAAGLKVGMFTSPHLHRFTERFQLNDVEVQKDVLFPHLERVLDLQKNENAPRLTFFEVATLAAFSLFREQKVDLAVLEVGLGGRLDSTSIASPRITAITSIGLDHTDYLGDTITQIAGEKASIANPGIPMVVASLEPEALFKVKEVTSNIGAPLQILGRDFQIDEDLKPPLPGKHQLENTAVAAKIFELIGTKYEACTKKVFADSLATTKWPGRFEILEAHPGYILDGAHNLEATKALVATLDNLSIKPEVLVFGALKNKPFNDMLKELRPQVKDVILTTPPISRAVDPQSYALETDKIASDSKQAIQIATKLAGRSSTILVTGSLFTVAAIRALILGEQTDPPIGL